MPFTLSNTIARQRAIPAALKERIAFISASALQSQWKKIPAMMHRFKRRKHQKRVIYILMAERALGTLVPTDFAAWYPYLARTARNWKESEGTEEARCNGRLLSLGIARQAAPYVSLRGRTPLPALTVHRVTSTFACARLTPRLISKCSLAGR